MNAARLILLLSVLPLAAMTKGALAITIDWVTVGDTGNTGQTQDFFTGFNLTLGSVDYEYRIMQFEFTNAQYATFLNAIDPDGTNPNSVYNSNMSSSPWGGITNTGTTTGSRYEVKSNMGDKPVNLVSWWDAARVSNWLHNGAQTYGTTDDTANAPQNTGAYSVGMATTGDAVPRNSVALFYIPTENEWHKAAFYNPTLNSGTGGYRIYGNGFDTTPGVVSADAFGVGSAGSTGNFANYNRGADWDGRDGKVTTVGTNGGSSYYGAFDMSGNLQEWNDLTGASGSSRGLRGGHLVIGNASILSSSSRQTVAPSLEDIVSGFRLASPVPSLDILLNVSFGTQTQGSAGYPLLTPDNAASVTKIGAGMVVFDAANTYTGPTRIQQGVLAITGPSTISSSSLISLSSGASLDVRSLGGGYTVPSGQTISGSGEVLGSVTFGAGSTLSPGMLSTASGASMLAADMQAGSLEAHVVPEPATLGLVVVGVGFLGLEALCRKRA